MDVRAGRDSDRPTSGPARRRRPRPSRRRRSSTVASPWPTSHATMTQPAGGQPVSGGRQTAIEQAGRQSDEQDRPRRDRQDRDGDQRDERRAATATATATRVTRRRAPPHDGRPSGSSSRTRRRRFRRRGSAAPRRAPTSPPSSPATVAGATAGAASRLATTATSEICPDIAAIAGVQTSWAAIGTAIASAHHRGIQRSRRRANGGASSRIPAVAVAERMKPADRDSHGSRNSSPTTAHASARTPPRAPNPSAATPDRAHRGGPDDAGVGPGEQHERDDRQRPEHPQPAPPYAGGPSHRHHDGQDDRQVGARDRHEVRQPAAAEVLLDLVADPPVVAVDQGRHQCLGLIADG